MPFNNNKWSLILEAYYQHYKSDNNGNNQQVKVDYKSIGLPIGIRHYFFINSKSKIFINGSYVPNFSLNSSIKFENNNNLTLEADNSLEVLARRNLSFGCGYNFNNKYNIEVRYGLNREIFNTYPNWHSKYNSLSLILSHSIF